MHAGVKRIALEEGVDVPGLGRARMQGEGALGEPLQAVAHQRGCLHPVERGKAVFAQGRVEGLGNVPCGVDQGAVEIEDGHRRAAGFTGGARTGRMGRKTAHDDSG